MNIQEMHQYFRVYGEQMGLELIRNILPEEIDVYLNTAINEKVREALVSSGNTQFQDRISIQNNPVNPISYIRTLYDEMLFIYLKGFTNKDGNAIKVKLDSYDVLHYIHFDICYFANNELGNGDTTPYYPFRYVDRSNLNSILNDFCSGASYDSPIIYFYGHNAEENVDIFPYVINDDSKQPALISGQYIKNPAKVSLVDNISCNLPNYTHTDIVQFACQKYFNTLQVTNNNVNQ